MTLLWERFREFAKDTEMIGSERVNGVNEIADSLISSGHTGKDQIYSVKKQSKCQVMPYSRVQKST